MKIVDPGHEYLLNEVGQSDGPQRVVFVKNEGSHYPGNVGYHAGIQTQELIRVAIDRACYLNNQGPCMETEHAVAALRQALAWFEVRAARCRGGHITADHAEDLEAMPTCDICGHNQCDRAGLHDRLPGTRRG